MSKLTQRQSLTAFVLRLGVVSLFADFTYEGSHAILGSFLAKLGASPLWVGFIAGSGEMLGYGMRLVSGRYADKTRRYWPIMSAGYILNLLAVPALAFVTTLAPAVTLILFERLGKGIRNPSRNVLLARAGEVLGHGRAFGIHEFLDQTGAVLGPLTVAVLVALSGYPLAFAALLLPAILAFIGLRWAYHIRPSLKPRAKSPLSFRFPALYFGYMAFAALTVMGFAHFILFSYHLAVSHRLAAPWIPVLYALAMAASGLAAIPTGLLFDRIGLKLLYAIPLLTLVTNPLLFLARRPLAIAAGTILWGVTLGVQSTCIRAGVARLVSDARRGSAFGLFDAGFGTAWMMGSLIMGGLYAEAPHDLVEFASGAELLALALLPWVLRRVPRPLDPMAP